ncbi:DUF4333 domain-containing protein [Streptomyces sp. NPDC046716]|uniref:DUF4333 domain-containing protein n=1 Tax=Streptomyces sp. NPDC046716 TaxID=3157093 RepID=UPI003401C89C
MRHTGRNKRIATAAALGALTVLLAGGCSLDVGGAKKDDATSGTDASTAQSPAQKEPAAEETPVDSSPSAPENTGVNEGGSVHKARVAQTISDELAASTGRRPSRVTCPAHLPARVGATIRCDLTAGSDTLGVTVTATAVNGKRVNYSIKVDDSVR